MSQLASARPLTADEKAQAYGDDLIAQIAQADARERSNPNHDRQPNPEP